MTARAHFRTVLLLICAIYVLKVVVLVVFFPPIIITVQRISNPTVSGGAQKSPEFFLELDDWNIQVSMHEEHVSPHFGTGKPFWSPVWRNVRIGPGVSYKRVESQALSNDSEYVVRSIRKGISVSFWSIVVSSLLLIGIALLTRHLKRSRLNGRLTNTCQCGYDLTGNVSGICPECGIAIKC